MILYKSDAGKNNISDGRKKAGQTYKYECFPLLMKHSGKEFS